jgi:plasmid stabilization system protein ParE
MAYQIKWTLRAEESYESNIAYLEAEWTDREISNFVNAVEKKLQQVAIFPEMFIRTNKRKNIRKTIINKQIVLFYRQHKKLKHIELILFWDSRRNPKTLKF